MKKMMILALSLVLAGGMAMAQKPTQRGAGKKMVQRATGKTQVKKSDYERAVEHYDNDEYDAALVIFEKMVAAHPDDGVAWAYIASIKQNDHLTGEAWDAALKAKPNLPDDEQFCAWYYAELANICKSRGDSVAALEHLSTAVSLQPDDAFYYGNRALLNQQMGRLAEAEADARKCISIDPDDQYSTIRLGCVIDEQGRFADALEVFDGVLEKDSDCVLAIANRASTLYNMARYSEAVDDVIRVLAIEPDNSHVAWLLPYLYSQDSAVVVRKLEAAKSNPALEPTVTALLESLKK